MLSTVRAIEIATFSGGAVGMHLADLGADVIKVEDIRRGDPVRRAMLAQGDTASPLHRRWNRGKRSIGIDLRHDRGREVVLALLTEADLLLDGGRPGTLARLGVNVDAVTSRNPQLVIVSLSGFGQNGPYAAMASHGDSFEAFAGLRKPYRDEAGLPTMPGSINAGIQTGPVYAALAATAAVIEARETGLGRRLDISQADTASYFNSLAIDDAATDRWRAERGIPPRGAYFGMPSDKRDPHGAGAGAVRCQYYEAKDGRFLLFNALEKHYFDRFAAVVDRPDLLELSSGKEFDHQYGDEVLRRVLNDIFATRTLEEWMSLALAHDVPIAPVNDGSHILDDPHFQARTRWLDPDLHGGSMMGFPAHADPPLPDPRPAPAHGADTAEVLTEVLGVQEAALQELAQLGVITRSPSWPTAAPVRTSQSERTT